MATLQQPLISPANSSASPTRRPVLIVKYPKSRGVMQLVYAGLFGAFLVFQVLRVASGHGSGWTYFLIAFNSVAAPTCVVLAVLAFTRDRPVLAVGPKGVLMDMPWAGRTRIPWGEFAGAEVAGSSSAKFLVITCLDPTSAAIERTKKAAALCQGLNKQHKLETGAAWLMARHLPSSPDQIAEQVRQVALAYLERAGE